MSTDCKDGILFVGHCTRDEITIGKDTTYRPGGGTYFGAASAGYAKKKYDDGDHPLDLLAIGKMEDHKQIIQELEPIGVRVKLLEDKCTTTFVHEFAGGNPDKRVSSVRDIARPYTVDDVKDYKYKVMYVNPLFDGEINNEVLAKLKENSQYVACDAQGLIRKQREKQIYLETPSNLRESLQYISIFKVDTVEAEALTGIKDVRQACLKLLEYGPMWIVCTQKEKVEVHTKDAVYEAPFTQWSLEGRTGRGDTVSGAFCFTFFILGKGIQEALNIAAAATSKKMMHAGAAISSDFE